MHLAKNSYFCSRFTAQLHIYTPRRSLAATITEGKGEAWSTSQNGRSRSLGTSRPRRPSRLRRNPRRKETRNRSALSSNPNPNSNSGDCITDAISEHRFADASIWMVQFMKAMRDERGEMVRNAHLLGFFRRICKLLFLRTKPVFVFDGGTPALKRRTVIARRRQRENAQAKIRKTAEKLLLNHVSFFNYFIQYIEIFSLTQHCETILSSLGNLLLNKSQF